MRHYKKYIALIILIVVTIYGYKKGVDFGMINANKIKIKVSDNLDFHKVKIVQGFFSINRKNDKEMFYEWRKNNIIVNNGRVHKPKTEYGENDFLVMYDNKQYFEFRHFKFEDIQDNIYSFAFQQTDSGLFLHVKIDPKQLEFTKRMNMIKDAENLLTNCPIDSSKVIYNMVELENK